MFYIICALVSAIITIPYFKFNLTSYHALFIIHYWFFFTSFITEGLLTPERMKKFNQYSLESMFVTLEKKITVSRTRKSGGNYLLNAHQWPIISINLTLQRNR